MPEATSLEGIELIPIVQNGTNKVTTPNKLKEGLATATQLNNKVDKEEGKGLSQQDFTTTLKNKLDGIEEQANKYEHPANHPATMITEDTTHRFVTDTEKNTWNSKANIEDIPDISELATKGELDIKADKIVVESVSEATKELQPNKYYTFGEVAELTITLAAGEENKLAEYMFEFTSGTTPTILLLPDSVKWIGDSTIETSKKYQVSIVNNIAVIGGVV